MGKQLQASKKPKKIKRIQVQQDDEFSLSDQQPSKQQKQQTKSKNLSMKVLMDEVVKTENNGNSTFLSSFTKPLERVKEEQRKDKTKKKEKASDDVAHKYINNPRLEKELKSATMRGVAKIMNMVSQYRKTHPQE